MTIVLDNVDEEFLNLIKDMIKLMPQGNYILEENIEDYTIKKKVYSTEKVANPPVLFMPTRSKEQIIEDLYCSLASIAKEEAITYTFEEIKEISLEW